MRMISRFRSVQTLVLALLVSIGCSGSAPEMLANAREALAEARYEDALEEARAGLGQGPDEVQRWGLELVVLEALARTGEGEAAVEQLDRVAELRPESVPASQYSATADQLRAAGSRSSAILVLDRGFQRFPDNAVLEHLICVSRQAPTVDSEELELLRTLGYLEAAAPGAPCRLSHSTDM